MSTFTSAEARQQMAELINRAAFGKERVVLTRRGKRMAALVPIEDLEMIEGLTADDDGEELSDGTGTINYLRAEDNPTLAAIWDNDEDAVYDTY